MTEKQPEALRLAQILADDADEHDLIAQEAAAELRRLHALCDEMGEALENAHLELKRLARAPDSAYAKPDRECIYEIEVALNKWK